jgi:aminoglycoside phosphotransferase family enzyme/predicted kinase
MPDGGKMPATGFIERLRLPACYPHPAAPVELLETHISWVLLAGDFAYKVKKPVDLGFVDFSTLAARRRYCEEELRLNRRTAPDLYLGVVPITGTPLAPVMGGDGEAFEYAVRMRRFPQEALLDGLAKSGALTERIVEDFARTVAAFHGGIARTDGAGPFGAPRTILADAVDNFAQLELLDDDAGTRAARQALASWTLREYNRLEEVFARRKHDGFVRECHGDLHLGNVAMLGGRPVPFDAIEFNDAFRWVDVMNEVAFPVMDLVHHGLGRLASRFVDAYLDATGDFAGLRVLRFYLVYRAMVRAKVSCIRARQAGIAEADRARSEAAYRGHLALAEQLSRPGSPAIIAMHGLSGSGKSTVSQGLVESLSAIRLRSDVERKRLHGLESGARSGSLLGGGLYTSSADRMTYAHLGGLARKVIAAGYPVVVDAAFLRGTWRTMFRELARDLGVPFVLVACAAPEAVLRERIVARDRQGTDASEAGLAVLDHQLASLEPLSAGELETAVIVDSSDSATAIAAAFSALSSRLGSPLP